MSRLIQYINLFLTVSVIYILVYVRSGKEKNYIVLTASEIGQYKLYIVYLFQIMFIVLLLLTLLLLIKSSLSKFKFFSKQLSNLNKESKLYKFLHKLDLWYNKYNFLFKTYSLIFEYVGAEYTRYIIVLAKHCLAFTKKMNLCFIFSFVVLPRLLILIIFISEIYIGTLHYYFYSLILLLIPLLFKFLLFVLKDQTSRCFPEIATMVIKDDTTPDIEILTLEGKKTFQTLGLKLAPDQLDLDLDILLTEFYYPLLFIEGHIKDSIEPLASKFSQFIVYLYYLIHVLGLGYILYLCV